MYGEECRCGTKRCDVAQPTVVDPGNRNSFFSLLRTCALVVFGWVWLVASCCVGPQVRAVPRTLWTVFGANEDPARAAQEAQGPDFAPSEKRHSRSSRCSEARGEVVQPTTGSQGLGCAKSEHACTNWNVDRRAALGYVIKHLVRVTFAGMFMETYPTCTWPHVCVSLRVRYLLFCSVLSAWRTSCWRDAVMVREQ